MNRPANDTASESSPSDSMKQCPSCAERVQSKALVCRFCGHDFSGDVVDYYQLVSLPRTASVQEIRSRCLELGKELCPDEKPQPPENIERFKQLELAYETLTDPELKRHYDVLLSNQALNNNQTGKVTSFQSEPERFPRVFLIAGWVLLGVFFVLYLAVSGTGNYASKEFDRCVERGVRYYMEIGSYPRLRDGRSADEVVKEGCYRGKEAF